MRKLVTSTALVGTSSLFGVLAAVIRNKLLAVFVGAAGVGLPAQIGNFLNALSALASLGIGVGMARYVVEYSSRSDYSALGKLRRSGVIVSWVGSGVAVIVAWIFSKKIAILLFGGPELAWAVAASVLAVPLLVQVSFHLAIMQGLKEMRQYAVANALASALGLVVLFPLVYFLRFSGAVIHLVAAGILSYFVVHLMSQRVSMPYFKKSEARFDTKMTRELLAYGASSLAVGTFYSLNLLAIRSVIMHRLGANANGLYQVAVGISFQYLMLILNSISTYAFPRLSELKEKDSIVNELRGSVRLSILLVTGCASLLLLARQWLIPLLFTREFIVARNLLPVQFIADFLRAIAWMVGIWLLPQGRLRVWVGFDLVTNVALFGAFFLLLGRMGNMGELALLAAPIAHCFGYLLHCIINYGYSRRSIGFSFGGPLRKLLLRSFLLIAVCGIIPSGSIPLSLVGLALVVLWARFSVSIDEARAGLAIARERLGRLGIGRK